MLSAIAEIDATIRVSSPPVACEVAKIEDRIITGFTISRSNSTDRTLAEIQKLLSQYPDGVELIILKKQNSIGVCFFCSSVNGLQSLKDMFMNGQLKVSLQVIFSALVRLNGDSWVIEIHKLEWLLGNYNTCMYILHAAVGEFDATL
jgi:hypothetical protein